MRDLIGRKSLTVGAFDKIRRKPITEASSLKVENKMNELSIFNNPEFREVKVCFAKLIIQGQFRQAEKIITTSEKNLYKSDFIIGLAQQVKDLSAQVAALKTKAD